MNRTRTVSTKITPEEHKLLLSRAEIAGMKPSVYYRNLLVGNDSEALRLLLAEVREMRTILFELLCAALNGRELTDEVITAIVKAAESTKFAKADKVLRTRSAR